MKKRTMLRAMSAIMTAALGMTIFPFSARAGDVSSLDVNGDSKVDITDATAVLSAYAEFSAFGTIPEGINADADGNGKIDISDATVILTHYAEQASSMQPPIQKDESVAENLLTKDATTEQGIVQSNLENVLFVGNSNFIGNPDDENVTCITGKNKGAMWTYKQEEAVLEYDNTNIVLCPSPKDTYDVLEYMRIYNGIRGVMQDVDKKNVEVYVMTLPPCTGKYDSLNAEITNFNAFLKSMCNSKIHFIDTYEFAQENGFETEEGLIYNEATQKEMYNFILSNISQ